MRQTPPTNLVHRAGILFIALATLSGCASVRSGTDIDPDRAPRPEPATPSGPGPSTSSAATDPSGPWLQYASPAEAGFDPDALSAVCDYADSVHSSALMAVFRGHVILACGDVDRKLEAHSVRKSLVSALYGTAVARGEVDLDATLGELGIGEDGGLTDEERSAAVRDVIAARSGVYLPAAYAPSGQDVERPERGSHPPGTHWFYNNWDFNVAGVVYERATGEDLYDSFKQRIAGPLGMEDWDTGDGFRVYEPTRSRHPAHTFRISARDLARLGQLYLQEGRWGDRQVVPLRWVRKSTRPVSDLGDGQGYGYMWWTYAAGSVSAESYPTMSRYASYMARGTGGQAVWVIPCAEMVIVHRVDTDHGRAVDGRDAWTLADRILAARVTRPDPDPDLMPVSAIPLSSQLEPYPWPEPVDVPAKVLDEYMGEYLLGSGAVIRVFRFEGHPYIDVPGEGVARMIPLGDDVLSIRVVPGVRVQFLRDEAGAVDGIQLTQGSQTLRAARQ